MECVSMCVPGYDAGCEADSYEEGGQEPEGGRQADAVGNKADCGGSRQSSRISERCRCCYGMLIGHGFVRAGRGVQNRNDICATQAHQREAKNGEVWV